MIELSEDQKKVLRGEVCGYCRIPTVQDRNECGIIWKCPKCGAYVGCHKNTAKALGRVANAELRKAKQEAHEWFDMIWKNDRLSRGQAYFLLQMHLGVPEGYCHIGMFSVQTCRKVVEFAKAIMDGRIAI